MINLAKLTVPYLKQLASECSLAIDKKAKKDDIIQKIKNSNIEKDKLQMLTNKFYNQYITSKSKGKKPPEIPNQAIINLEKRIELLEKQVKFLMTKIGGVEAKIAKEISSEILIAPNHLAKIKNIIKSKIYPGESMTVDELLKINELQKYPISLIEQGVSDLIDDEVIDVSDGFSTQKIGGTIGLLIRR